MRPQNDTYLATERREIIATGLANPPTGTINLNVLVFAAVPSFALGTFNRGEVGTVTDMATQMATWTNSATLGTSCKLLKRGTYQLTLVGDITGDIDVRFGISVDTATLAGIFGNATVGFEVACSISGKAAADSGTCLTTCFYVDDPMAGNAIRGIVRFHAVLQDGNPLTSIESFEAADIRAHVRYLGDFMGA